MEQQLPVNVINCRLAEIACAVPQAVWTTEIPDAQYGVTVSLPYSNFISGTLFVSQGRLIYIDIFSVPEELQKSGIGSRLLRAFTKEAQEYGAEHLLARCTSSGALKTLAGVFGQENLSYHSVNQLGKLGNIIPKQYGDLLNQIIETGSIDIGIGVHVSAIDTSEWPEII